jgi:hypothetical protein
MSRVLISIITNSKKEDSENAISNDLETQNFPANHGNASWECGPLSNKLPTPWETQLWYLHKHTMQVHLTDQIQSIKAQCNAVYPNICFRKCSHFSHREKYKNIFSQTPLLIHTIPHRTFCHQQPSVISPHSVYYGPFL